MWRLGAIAAAILAIVSLITSMVTDGDILNGSFVLDGFSKGVKNVVIELGNSHLYLSAISDDKKGLFKIRENIITYF